MWYVRAFWRKGREDLVGPGKGADLGGRAGLARNANHAMVAVAELGGGGGCRIGRACRDLVGS